MHCPEIAVIGAPLDLGAGRRGVDMGPSAIRVAGLDARLAALGYSVSDAGNIETEQAESVSAGNPSARYLEEIAKACKRLAVLTERTLEQGKVPLVLGGDHSVAVGTVSGVARHYKKKRKRIGLIWIDAHADMNTPETSPSGNVHGMPLACLLGMGPRELTHLHGYSPKVSAKNTVLVGIRDVDQLEKPHVKQSGISAFTMRDIDERGLRAVMNDAIGIACAGTEGFHLSLDMDSVDPQFAPGVGTPVRGGITYREAHLAMELLNDSRRMISMEIVEVNPVMDESNRTAELAVELAMSALGKRIL
ncbi:MAG: arginase [Candidatus Solibacter usitatus]|nr:arginase [Candidatus Solibacter usitatus]